MHVKESDSVAIFKTKLKTRLFERFYVERMWAVTLWELALYKTYLLLLLLGYIFKILDITAFAEGLKSSIVLTNQFKIKSLLCHN